MKLKLMIDREEYLKLSAQREEVEKATFKENELQKEIQALVYECKEQKSQ